MSNDDDDNHVDHHHRMDNTMDIPAAAAGAGATTTATCTTTTTAATATTTATTTTRGRSSHIHRRRRSHRKTIQARAALSRLSRFSSSSHTLTMNPAAAPSSSSATVVVAVAAARQSPSTVQVDHHHQKQSQSQSQQRRRHSISAIPTMPLYPPSYSSSSSCSMLLDEQRDEEEEEEEQKLNTNGVVIRQGQRDEGGYGYDTALFTIANCDEIETSMSIAIPSGTYYSTPPPPPTETIMLGSRGDVSATQKTVSSVKDRSAIHSSQQQTPSQDDDCENMIIGLTNNPSSSNRITQSREEDPHSLHLHAICETSQTLEEFLDRCAATATATTTTSTTTTTMAVSTRHAGTQDQHGRTPLHCLSLNANLAHATLTREQKELLESNHENNDHEPTIMYEGITSAATTTTNYVSSNYHKHKKPYVGKTLFPDPHEHVSKRTSTTVEQDFVDFVVTELWRAYRPAMITPDQFNYIPFQEALTIWVKESHIVHPPMSSSSPQVIAHRSSQFWNTSNFRNRLTNHTIQQSGSKQDTVSSSSRDDVQPPRNLSPSSVVVGGGGDRSGLLLGQVVVQPFPRVRLTPQAIFCFTLLSAMIDRVDERVLLSATPTYKPHMGRHTSQWDGFVSTTLTSDGERQLSNGHNHSLLHKAVTTLRTMSVEDIGSEIVQSIASIPDLIKSIMLIEDRRQREYVLSTVIVRRVLMNKYSVGGWLTRMLGSVHKRVSDCGIEYLRILSDPDLFDSAAPKPRSSWRRSKSFPRIESSMNQFGNSRKYSKKNVEQEDLYNKISNLQDFVPSLLSLGARDVEDAATTLVVKKVLDQLITRPFAATVIICDALLLILLITGLRVSTNRLLLGAPKNVVVNYLYMAGTGLFYFIIRELGKAVSLLMVTKRARVYFWSFWNLCDMISTILALASIIAVRQMCNSAATTVDSSLRTLIAITTGFLWLRVLSFLKGINEHLATFVLCIITIISDVIWFCVILFTLVVAFAQMFFTLLVPAYCSDPNASEYDGECTPSEYYLNAYSILLGGFGNFVRDDFATVFSVFLAVFFTFTVVLVLLNVLIAVASDSYEKCLLRSANLFGRARVMLIAELVSFQNLLRHNVDDETRVQRRVYNAWWSSGVHGWSRGSVMFFVLAVIIVIAWILYDIIAAFSGQRYGNILLGLGSMFINILIFLGIMIFLSSGTMGISRQRVKNSTKITSSDDDLPSYRCLFSERYGHFLQQLMIRLLGSSYTSSTSDLQQYPVDGWHGRLVFLQNEMIRLADESNEETTAKLQVLETTIQRTDARMRTELANLETCITEFQADLRKTLSLMKGNNLQHRSFASS